MAKTYEASIQIESANLLLDITSDEFHSIGNGQYIEKGYTDYLNGISTFYLFKFNDTKLKAKSLVITVDNKPIFTGLISDLTFSRGTTGSLSVSQKLVFGLILLLLTGVVMALSSRSVTDDIGITTPRKIIQKP